jgi:hypothetical protein
LLGNQTETLTDKSCSTMSKPGRAADTPTARKLEADRVKRAFAELSESWWWFNETERVAHQDNRIAWQWEFLRRTKTYRGFCAKAEAIRVQDARDPSLAGFVDSGLARGALQRLARSYRRLGDADPCLRWPDLFSAGCSRDVCWAALPKTSRTVVNSARPLYPRAEVAAAFTNPGGDAIQVEPIIVKRLSSGQEELTCLAPGPSTAILGRYQVTSLLPSILSANSVLGVYIVLIFDVRNAEFTLTRLGEHSVLSRFSAILQNNVSEVQTWLRDTHHTAPTPRPSLARVVPLNMPYWCEAWIPADAVTEPADILARFRTLIDSRTRRQWLPGCQKVWRKLFPSFSAVSIAPLQAKRAWIKDVRDMQAGLCAYDCRRIEARFTQHGLLIPFLKKHLDSLSLADPDRLHDVWLQIKRIIEDMDAFYARRPAS